MICKAKFVCKVSYSHQQGNISLKLMINYKVEKLQALTTFVKLYQMVLYLKVSKKMVEDKDGGF